MGHHANLPAEVVTNALRGVAARQPGAFDEVWTLVYPWVVQRAKLLLHAETMRPELGEPCDLAHEAFLRLKPCHLAACRDRLHLIRIATRAMRQALVDRARRRRVAAVVVPMSAAPDREPAFAAAAEAPFDVALLLDELQSVNARLAEVATLHVVGGLTFVEIARVLAKSEAWARMAWGQASSWLGSRLGR